MSEQAPLLEPHALRAEALLVEGMPSLGLGHGIAGRVDALGEIPEPLPPAPSGDGDLAPQVQDRQHVADAPGAVPAVVARLALGAVVELAGEQRASLLELSHDVAPERPVLGHELSHPAFVRVVRRRPPAAHHAADHRQRLDRPDEGVPLEQRPLLPEQPVELGAVEGAEPAPEHELLRRRDGGDRVELEVAELPHGREHVVRRAVERLGADRDPASLLDADLCAPGSHPGIEAPATPQQLPSRASWPT